MRFFTILLSALLLFGCKSSEKNSRSFDPQPFWVDAQPIVGGYYVGVYGVQKTNGDYRNAAKNGALENLASEISIEISGESVLHTSEINGAFDQEYQQNIKFSSKQSLSGYELVDTWESPTEYWVYYKLSKSEYLRIKKEKEEAAIKIAKDYFGRAKGKRAESEYRQAFTLSIQGLESLSEYLDQPLQTEYEGRQVYLATEILSFVQDMVDEISLIPNVSSKSIKLGSAVAGSDLYVDIVSSNKKKLVGIPLVVEYKALFLKKFNVQSDAQGRAGIELGLINQSQMNQIVTVNMDFEELTRQTTKNRMIVSLMKYLPSKEVKILLTVTPPSVFVESIEKDFGKPVAAKLKEVVIQTLIDKGFQIEYNKSKADLILTVTSDTKSAGQVHGANLVFINGNIRVVDRKTNNLVFSEVFAEEKGLQSNLERASSDAYSKVGDYVRRRVIPRLANQYFSF